MISGTETFPMYLLFIYMISFEMCFFQGLFLVRCSCYWGLYIPCIFRILTAYLSFLLLFHAGAPWLCRQKLSSLTQPHLSLLSCSPHAFRIMYVYADVCIWPHLSMGGRQEEGWVPIMNASAPLVTGSPLGSYLIPVTQFTMAQLPNV